MSVARSVELAVIAKARELGLRGTDSEVEEFVLYMVNSSAIATNRRGNRRYGSLYFTVRGGVVLDIRGKPLPRCAACDDTGVVSVPDGTMACPECRKSTGVLA